MILQCRSRNNGLCDSSFGLIAIKSLSDCVLRLHHCLIIEGFIFKVCDCRVFVGSLHQKRYEIFVTYFLSWLECTFQI